jgi:signal transduction histidine kinase
MPKEWNNGMYPFHRKSLGLRLISAFIAVIVVVLLAISVFSIVRWKNKALATLMNKGETMVNLLSSNARIGIFSENRDQLREAAAGFAAEPDVLLVGIYNADRKPLYVSDPAFPGSDNAPENGEIAGPASTIREGQAPRTGSLMLEFSRPVALTLLSNDVKSLYFGDRGTGAKKQVIGYVKIVLGQDSLNHEIRQIVIQNVIIALIFICASILVVYLWVKKITKPLETLTREVKALGEGRDVAHMPVETMDEIGRLAKAFNTMLDERKIAEQTRKNILRDLHDGVGGMMTNIIILSEISRTRPIPGEVTETLATISALSREGINEIRSLIYSLDRRDLNWSSLIAEMRNQGHKIVEPHMIAFEMTAKMEKYACELGSLLCLHLFKIYREALTNSIKHSHAKSITVDMSVMVERVLLTVRDDGRGCNAAELSGNGRGVTNMRSRAAEVGGTVTITGEAGTCVSVDIPFPKARPYSP